MKVPLRSTLSMDLNLARSLIIFEVLKLELALDENYDHHATAYLDADILYIGQGGVDDARTVALEFLDDGGDLEVVLGYNLAFDAVELAPDDIGDEVMVSVEEFEKLMPDLQMSSPLHSVYFGPTQYLDAAKLIYKWLFSYDHKEEVF